MVTYVCMHPVLFISSNHIMGAERLVKKSFHEKKQKSFAGINYETLMATWFADIIQTL